MKYCTSFYQGNRAMETADEIIIKYTEVNEHLVDFVAESHCRIIANITELSDKDAEDSLSIFEQASKVKKDFTVLLSKDQNIISDLYELNIKYFFIEGVSTLKELDVFMDLDVTDVYIQNELGFDIQTVAERCNKRKDKINIRVFPNVAQSSGGDAGLNSFFIRPDDIDLYEDFIDVVEFFGPIDRQPVLTEIYKEGRWLGELSLLIIGLDVQIDNRTIVPLFGITRIMCKHLCEKGKCGICNKIIDVSNSLVEKEILLYKRKNDGSGTIKDDMQDEGERVASIPDEGTEEL